MIFNFSVFFTVSAPVWHQCIAHKLASADGWEARQLWWIEGGGMSMQVTASRRAGDEPKTAPGALYTDGEALFLATLGYLKFSILRSRK